MALYLLADLSPAPRRYFSPLIFVLQTLDCEGVGLSALGRYKSLEAGATGMMVHGFSSE
jgi:hypothetical protein